MDTGYHSDNYTFHRSNKPRKYTDHPSHTVFRRNWQRRMPADRSSHCCSSDRRDTAHSWSRCNFHSRTDQRDTGCHLYMRLHPNIQYKVGCWSHCRTDDRRSGRIDPLPMPYRMLDRRFRLSWMHSMNQKNYWTMPPAYTPDNSDCCIPPPDRHRNSRYSNNRQPNCYFRSIHCFRMNCCRYFRTNCFRSIHYFPRNYCRYFPTNWKTEKNYCRSWTMMTATKWMNDCWNARKHSRHTLLFAHPIAAAYREYRLHRLNWWG